MKRKVELGIDGNCGYALLGNNLQEGEAEFVEVANPGGYQDRVFACKVALRQLRKKLGKPYLRYFFGESHPYKQP